MDSLISSPMVTQTGDDQNKATRVFRFPSPGGLTDAEVDEVINDPELGISGYFNNSSRHDVRILYGKQGTTMFGHRAILRRRSEWLRRELDRDEYRDVPMAFITVKEEMDPGLFHEAIRLIYDCRPTYGKGKTQRVRDMPIEFVRRAG